MFYGLRAGMARRRPAHAASGDRRYTLILPNGKVLGTTGGKNPGKVWFYAECYMAAEEQDSRFYLDEEYRVK